jgi:transcriptional regulator with XRE-family HTH domain
MNLQTYMDSLSLKDKQVAGSLGIARSFVSQIRRGQREPSLRLACHIETWSRGAVTPRELLTAD